MCLGMGEWEAMTERESIRKYLRWGAIPPGERSYNRREGHLEPGVSVGGEVAIDADGEYWWVGKEPLISLIGRYELDSTRPIYLVTGRVVDTGSDGEPLLRHVRILARLRVGPKGGYVPMVRSAVR